VPVLILEDL
jgi:hypothetical protein